MKKKTTDIRCRAVIFHRGKILAVKHSIKNNFYALPGGHLEWGENVSDCMKREIIEELGVEPKIGRLLYVRNFIDKDKKQSIEFYFEIINSFDYININALGGTHKNELAEICWIGKSDHKKILPTCIQQDLNSDSILSDLVKLR